MTDPDRVFAQFVEANPLPDATIDEHPEPPALDPRRQRRLLATKLARPDPPASLRQRTAWTVSVAASVLVLVVAGLWMTQRSTTETGPASRMEEPGPDVLARQYQDAINRGDVATAMELSQPAYRTTPNQRVAEWQAVLAANGMPTTLGDCEIEPVTDSSGRVTCSARLGDLVAVELGVAELQAPFDYSEGLLAWRPLEGGDFSQVNRAYADYLRRYHPDDYNEVCGATAYEPGSVVLDKGLALTGECAELVAPLAGEVVDWIRRGRPEAQD
jgi:hypothetical protein